MSKSLLQRRYLHLVPEGHGDSSRSRIGPDRRRDVCADALRNNGPTVLEGVGEAAGGRLAILDGRDLVHYFGLAGQVGLVTTHPEGLDKDAICRKDIAGLDVQEIPHYDVKDGHPAAFARAGSRGPALFPSFVQLAELVVLLIIVGGRRDDGDNDSADDGSTFHPANPSTRVPIARDGDL